ncbi:hypothetical protein EV681_1335 [Advenella incenata]|jgi:hypothetical protein|uniref:Uncharacterized protein n=1 Tax=Advenella incenata TaxID=267800 RepID=A0A4Q7VST4_9BURK|nr:hypothetical protein EV681_1335 [Advenella incenata]
MVTPGLQVSVALLSDPSQWVSWLSDGSVHALCLAVQSKGENSRATALLSLEKNG